MSDTSPRPAASFAGDRSHTGTADPAEPVPPPPPLQLPPTGKKSLARRPASWVVLAVVVVAVLAVVAVVMRSHAKNVGSASSLSGGAAGNATGSDGASTPSAGSSGVPTTATAAIQTLVSQHGSGFAALPQFTVPTSAKGWLVHYLFNCAPSGSSGTFAMYVDDASGLTTGVAANELALDGGSTYYSFSHGTYSLQINSQCNWAAVVQTIPQ